MLDLKTAKERVSGYILENFLFNDATRMPSEGDSLLEKGVIDSTGVLELIDYLEKEFQINIGDQEITPANLDSIGKITAFVEMKRR